MMMITLSSVVQGLRHNRLYVVGFFVLVLSFNLNVFGLGSNSKWFDEFERFSESIVYKTIECKDAVDNYGGLVRTADQSSFSKYMYHSGCGTPGYVPYVSQFGLQGRVFSALKPGWISFDRYIKIIEFVLTILMAAVLMVLVRKIIREFGKNTGSILYVFIAFSPWIAGYARNLYWVAFILLLPFVFSYVTYEWFKQSKRLHLFYGALFIVFLVKFLSGYEFASTLLLSAFIPIVYHEVKDKAISIVSLWRQALIVLGIGVVTLGLAIAINAVGLRAQTNTWGEAFQLVAGRAEDRGNLNSYKKSVVYGLKRTAPAAYKMIERVYDIEQMRSGEGSIIKYLVVSALNYAMLPAITIPFVMHEPLGTILQSIIFWIVVSAICLRILYRRHKGSRAYSRVRALGYSYALGLIGALSWLVLMPGHAFAHPHIDAIVFYLPFLMVAYIIVGLTVRPLIKKTIKYYTRNNA